MEKLMGPVAGLWIIAICSLIAIVAGMSPREGPPFASITGAICFTLATGFLAVAEAISRRASQ